MNVNLIAEGLALRLKLTAGVLRLIRKVQRKRIRNSIEQQGLRVREYKRNRRRVSQHRSSPLRSVWWKLLHDPRTRLRNTYLWRK